jgi:hypothetical protein
MKKTLIATLAAAATFGICSSAFADVTVSNVPVTGSITGDNSTLTAIIFGSTTTAGQPNTPFGFTAGGVNIDYSASIGSGIVAMFQPQMRGTNVDQNITASYSLNPLAPLTGNDAGGSINVTFVGSGVGIQNANAVQAVAYTNSLVSSTGTVVGTSNVTVSAQAGNGLISTSVN